MFRTWMRSISSNYHRKWMYYLRLLWGYRPPSPVDPYRFNVHVPMTYTMVWAEAARHMQALFATEPPFHCEPYNSDLEAEIKGEAAETTIWRLWRRNGKWRSVLAAMVDSMTYGMGWEQCEWEFDNDARVIRRDGPRWRRVSPLDITWNPMAADIDDTPVIRWRIVSGADIAYMRKMGYKFDSDPEAYLGMKTDKPYTINDLYQTIGLDGPQPLMESYRRQYEAKNKDMPAAIFLEYHDDEVTFSVNLADGKLVSAPVANESGLKPFVCYQYRNTGDFMVGQGLVAPIAPLQEGENTFFNASLDNLVAASHMRYFVDKTSNIKRTDLIATPNSVIGVNNPSGKPLRDVVMPFQANVTEAAAWEAHDRMVGWAEKAVGQSMMSQGAGAARQETYGATALQMQASQMRLYIENETWGRECIARAARIDYGMIRQHLRADMEVPLTGRKVPLADVTKWNPNLRKNGTNNPTILVNAEFFKDANFEFIPSGAAGLAVREYAQQQITALLTQLMADPYIGAQPIPGATQAAVEMRKQLVLRQIAASEVEGKSRVLRSVSEAFDAYAQNFSHEAQQEQAAQQPPPASPEGPGGQQPSPSGSPSGPPSFPDLSMYGAPEDTSAPQLPEAPPMEMQ